MGPSLDKNNMGNIIDGLIYGRQIKIDDQVVVAPWGWDQKGNREVVGGAHKASRDSARLQWKISGLVIDWIQKDMVVSNEEKKGMEPNISEEWS